MYANLPQLHIALDKRQTNVSFAIMVRKVCKTGPPPAPKDELEGCDFETAITHAGFGKFNVLLMIVGLPSGWTSILETNTMSYVFPAAQCDLNLSMQDKGMLNAATYIGTDHFQKQQKC